MHLPLALLTTLAIAAGSGAHTSASWVEARWSAAEPPADYGIGVVTFRPLGNVLRDTIAVRTAPSSNSSIVAYLVFREIGNGWEYLLLSSETLSPNFLEYGYEEAGVPIDSVAQGRDWVRVVYGSTAKGAARIGWARVPEQGHRIILWAEQLPKRELFFRSGITPEFRLAPRVDGPLQEVPISGRDYIMHPLEVHGPWMKVRVAAPSDYCADVGTTRGEYWIDYLDARGRPRVWYYSRGC